MGKTKKEDKDSKPKPPKKALTAFFLYKQDLFQETKQANPDAKVTEITKIISEQWKKVDAATKEKYDKKHEDDKARYEKDVQKYEAEHGPIEKKPRKKKKAAADDDDEDEEDEDSEEEKPKKDKKAKGSKKK